MQFLKTLLIVFTVGLAVAFAFNNWTGVDIRLWGGLLVDINKPLLLLICFLLGLIPTFLWQRARRWRLEGRLAAADRTIADLRAAIAAPAVAAPLASDPLPVVEGEPVVAPAAPPLIDEARP